MSNNLIYDFYVLYIIARFPSVMPENAIIKQWLIVVNFMWIVDILPGAQLYLFIITSWNKTREKKLSKKGIEAMIHILSS